MASTIHALWKCDVPSGQIIHQVTKRVRRGEIRKTKKNQIRFIENEAQGIDLQGGLKASIAWQVASLLLHGVMGSTPII